MIDNSYDPGIKKLKVEQQWDRNEKGLLWVINREKRW